MVVRRNLLVNRAGSQKSFCLMCQQQQNPGSVRPTRLPGGLRIIFNFKGSYLKQKIRKNPKMKHTMLVFQCMFILKIVIEV